MPPPPPTPGLENSPGGGNGSPPQYLPGKSHGQRSLGDCSPWDRRVRQHLYYKGTDQGPQAPSPLLTFTSLGGWVPDPTRGRE